MNVFVFIQCVGTVLSQADVGCRLSALLELV